MGRGQCGGRKTATRAASYAAVVVLVWGFSQSALAANPQDAQDSGASDSGFFGDSIVGWILGGNLGIGDDPFVDYTTVHDKGANATSATGIFTGPGATANTHDTGGGEDAYYNASKFFNLGANQQLIFGGLYQYDSSRTNYSSSSPASIGAGNVVRRDLNSFAGRAAYLVGDAYFIAGVGGMFGNGSWTNTIGGISGNFDSTGYTAGGTVGKVFTLFDSRTQPHSALLVKAPPKPSGGYAVQLDLSAHLAYVHDDVGGFTDNTGFLRGDEVLHYGLAGAKAMLFATMPEGRLTWIPSVGATIDQQLGYSHTLTFPVQPGFGFPGDVVSYGSAQTLVGAEIGLAARDVSGFVVGVHGFYRESAEYQIAGAQAYLRYVFPQ